MLRSFVLRGGTAALLIVSAALVYRHSQRPETVPERVVEGRLVGAAYGVRPKPRASERPLAAANAAAPRSRVRGVAAKTVGDLESCVRSEAANDRCWSDLSAAYVEAGRNGSDPQDFVRALAAADRALMIAPVMPEALFNRAVALESLYLRKPAAVAWRRYLTVDGDSQWAAEARERKRALDAPSASDAWAEAIPQLERAVRDADTRRVEDLVRTFPQETRSYGERRFMADWQEALSAGDSERATHRLAMSRQIGSALQRVNGETLLMDAIDAIDSAPADRIGAFLDAYHAYGRGRELYAARKTTAAQPFFEQSAAMFRRLRSPMFRMAEYYVAGCLSDNGDQRASLETVERHLGEVPERYFALRAQLHWQKAIAQSRTGLMLESLASFTRALELFDRQGEYANASQIRAALDVLYATVGREQEAWHFRVEAFRDVSRAANLRALQTALMGAAAAEAARERWDTAMAFYGVAITRELSLPNPVHTADAATWRALMAHRLGWAALAERMVARARADGAALEDPALQASAARRLQLTEASVVRDRDPARAAALLTALLEEETDRFRFSQAYLERGRAWRALGRNADAIADLREALAIVERDDEQASKADQWDTYFATADAAAEELIDVLDAEGRATEALAVAERTRARAFAPAGPARRDERNVPEGVVVAHYTALADRLLVFVMTSRATTVRRVPVTREALEERIAQLTGAIERGDDLTVNARGRELYDRLIAPLGSSMQNVSQLVIVPDVTVARVPFAALRTPAGRYLIDEPVAFTFAPSAGAIGRDRASRRGTGPPRVLAVGDPEFDHTLFPELPRLPAAGEQAREVAAIYTSANVLVGVQATPGDVVRAMLASDIIDLAAHAIVDLKNPAKSALLLASSPDSAGILYMGDIADLSVSADVVMLAGCETSAIVADTPPALRSFAFAFLAAGSRTVIGSIWAANDETSRAMSRYFHRSLRDGAAPAVALRDAQRAMLRSSNPELRTPRAWSGYQLYGSGS